uniref:Conotoxin superfamily I5 n=1 Tax=Conus magus TaxID=6492 RepID=A0A5P8I0N1_CONMA|nr:conotoxin superfamily I5 [Conus magus]
MVKMFRPTYFSFLLLSVVLLDMMSMVVCRCPYIGPQCDINVGCTCRDHRCCRLSHNKPTQCMHPERCKHAHDRRQTILTRDKFISVLHGREPYQ